MKYYSTETAPFDGVYVITEGGNAIIFFDCKPLSDVKEDDIYKSSYERVTACGLDYDSIVAAIVSDRYNPNDMAAIQNNFLRTLMEPQFPNADKYQSEMIALQSWRDKAKAVAKEVIEKLNK